jgi:glycerate-2-kinase
MVIKNFEKLASSPLRGQALKIAEAGLSAINTAEFTRKHFLFDAKKQQLKILGRNFDLKPYKRIVCVGFGKAALEAVTEIQKILKDRISCGFVIDLTAGDLGNIICKIGTHPKPTIINVQATKELVAMLEDCEEDDLVICVVSGGGSALLCYPQELTCEEESALIAALTAGGATIAELNTVRKHISRVKGGQLAKIIYPATCLSLIFSDVPGDDISVVASGPTVKDTTTMRDAAMVLKKYDVLAACQLPSCKLAETPKDDKYFSKIHNILFVSATVALAAMKDTAETLGWKVKIFSGNFQGEAKQLGPQIIKASQPGQCLLGAGESTVKVLGPGKGGRNQEMALAALSAMGEDQTLVCLASDGHDNTEAAGAIVDAFTLKKARSLGLDYRLYLEINDSFNFFASVDDALYTGLTGSNVSDLVVCLRE